MTWRHEEMKSVLIVLFQVYYYPFNWGCKLLNSRLVQNRMLMITLPSPQRLHESIYITPWHRRSSGEVILGFWVVCTADLYGEYPGFLIYSHLFLITNRLSISRYDFTDNTILVLSRLTCLLRTIFYRKISLVSLLSLPILVSYPSAQLDYSIWLSTKSGSE